VVERVCETDGMRYAAVLTGAGEEMQVNRANWGCVTEDQRSPCATDAFLCDSPDMARPDAMVMHNNPLLCNDAERPEDLALWRMDSHRTLNPNMVWDELHRLLPDLASCDAGEWCDAQGAGGMLDGNGDAHDVLDGSAPRSPLNGLKVRWSSGFDRRVGGVRNGAGPRPRPRSGPWRRD